MEVANLFCSGVKRQSSHPVRGRVYRCSYLESMHDKADQPARLPQNGSTWGFFLQEASVNANFLVFFMNWFPWYQKERRPLHAPTR